MTGAVQVTVDGAIASVVLAHPGRFNAMTRSMWHALKEVFVRLHADTSVRCVLLQGEGGHFCAGGDISEYPDFRFSEPSLRAFHEDDVWGGLQAVLDCDIPVVALIDGNCMGAGMEIASCCDIRLASEAARFGAPIARLGFPMAPREAQLVSQAAGMLTARQMLLEAAVLDATEMKDRGFLHRVLPAGELEAEGARTASRVASLAPEAARLNKQTLRQLSERNGPPALANAAQGAIDLIANAYRYADSPEHREGVTAFLEKRSPAF